MPILSMKSKFFCWLFGLLTVAALAQDVYIWQTEGNVFSFAALGGVFKHYFPGEFKETVGTLGEENFNILLTPILALPGVYLFGGLTIFSFVAGFISMSVKKAKMSSGDQTYGGKRVEALSAKDKLKYRVK